MTRRRVLPHLLRFGRRISAGIFAPKVEDEVREELEFHVRMRARELEAAGLTPEAARREAERSVVGRAELEAECRRVAEEREAKMRRTGWLDGAARDVRFAIRQLVREPVFALAAVLTLGLGIGANTAVFSAVRGVLLRPLPYTSPEQLVSLNTKYLPISGFDIERFPLSIPELRQFREQSTTVTSAAAYGIRTGTLGAGEGVEPLRVSVGAVTADLFPLLGVQPELGAWISPEQDRPDVPLVAVLSHDLWRSRFGADPGIIGGTLTLSGRPTRVVGVMPEGFVFPTADEQLWIPFGLDWSDQAVAGHFLSAVGRLAPGATLDAARVELAALAERWPEQHEHWIGHFITAEDLRRDLVGDARSILLLLQGAVLLVLAIACVNVANLSLARAEGRRHEIAVRASIGAGRRRIAAQLLTEALVLATLGAALGWVFAAQGAALLPLLAADALPRGEAVHMDVGVLLFNAAVGIGAAVGFGAIPALRASLSEPAGDLVHGGRGADGAGSPRVRRLLVGAEVALTLLVVTSAGLIGKSLAQTLHVDPGIRSEGLIVAEVALPVADYPEPEQVMGYYSELEERLASLPGVTRVSGVSALPLTGRSGRWDFWIDGREQPAQGERMQNGFVSAVRPGYFEVAEIKVTAGRAPTAADRTDTEPVVWINERAAELFWPGEDPVGSVIRFSPVESDAPRFRIAGVVESTAPVSLRDEPEPQIFFAHAQQPLLGGIPRSLSVLVRTSADAEAVMPLIQRAVRELDDRLPVPEVRPMDDVVLRSVAGPRMTTWVLGGFGALALLLACVGVYGVTSYAVAKRRREIGIRRALGAPARPLAALIVREGLAPALGGVVIGLGVALASAPLIDDLLFAVSPRDPGTFLVAPAGLLIAALLATALPARRALHIAPTEALKEE
jgi:predicted permease